MTSDAPLLNLVSRGSWGHYDFSTAELPAEFHNLWQFIQLLLHSW